MLRSGHIKQKWIGMHPYLRMDPKFWLDVLDAVKERGVDTNSDAAMKKLILEVERGNSFNENRGRY